MPSFWFRNRCFTLPVYQPTAIAGTPSTLPAWPRCRHGSVTSIANNNDTGRNESISYDPLDRILQAQTAATSGQDCWGLNFGADGKLADDALGNLLLMSVFKCSGPSLSVSVNGNNQISSSGFSYNAVGDITGDTLYSYTFNGANEITSANGVNYTYDADGLRVEKSSGTLYWRAYTGQVIEETDTSGNEIRSYFFFDGRRVAWRDSSGNVYYYFNAAERNPRALRRTTPRARTRIARKCRRVQKKAALYPRERGSVTCRCLHGEVIGSLAGGRNWRPIQAPSPT